MLSRHDSTKRCSEKAERECQLLRTQTKIDADPTRLRSNQQVERPSEQTRPLDFDEILAKPHASLTHVEKYLKLREQQRRYQAKYRQVIILVLTWADPA